MKHIINEVGSCYIENHDTAWPLTQIYLRMTILFHPDHVMNRTNSALGRDGDTTSGRDLFGIGWTNVLPKSRVFDITAEAGLLGLQLIATFRRRNLAPGYSTKTWAQLHRVAISCSHRLVRHRHQHNHQTPPNNIVLHDLQVVRLYFYIWTLVVNSCLICMCVSVYIGARELTKIVGW